MSSSTLDQRNLLADRLCNKHAVERIPIMKRQLGQNGRVLGVDS